MNDTHPHNATPNEDNSAFVAKKDNDDEDHWFPEDPVEAARRALAHDYLRAWSYAYAAAQPGTELMVWFEWTGDTIEFHLANFASRHASGPPYIAPSVETSEPTAAQLEIAKSYLREYYRRYRDAGLCTKYVTFGFAAHVVVGHLVNFLARQEGSGDLGWDVEGPRKRPKSIY
jgi:hypothetical protein